MKVYIIKVESRITGNVYISSEGYTSLEAAKEFIRHRGDYEGEQNKVMIKNGQEIDIGWHDWCYCAKRNIYYITDIDIRG